MPDEIILVDLFDRPVGSGEKEEIHRAGLLHRAFSVFLFDGDRMLIQQRALYKYHSGGLWANACCSHPRVGEDTAKAARRRLKEECGIECDLSESFSFIYRQPFDNGLCEYEYDHVFIGEYHGAATPDPGEISRMRWVKIAELQKLLMTRPQDFTAWFVIAAPRVLASRLQK